MLFSDFVLYFFLEHSYPWFEVDGRGGFEAGDSIAAEIPEPVPLGPCYGGRGGEALVPTAGKHHWHLCSRGTSWNIHLYVLFTIYYSALTSYSCTDSASFKGFWWDANRLHQFLHPAIYSDASSTAQKSEGRLFLLQCPYRDAAHRPDEWCSYPSQTGMITTRQNIRTQLFDCVLNGWLLMICR